jgi:hypothetical protein
MKKRSKKKVEQPIDPWISINLSLPKIIPGDGCSEEVLTRGSRGEFTATWDGRRWVGWDGNTIEGVEHWTTEGVARY